MILRFESISFVPFCGIDRRELCGIVRYGFVTCHNYLMFNSVARHHTQNFKIYSLLLTFPQNLLQKSDTYDSIQIKHSNTYKILTVYYILQQTIYNQMYLTGKCCSQVAFNKLFTAFWAGKTVADQQYFYAFWLKY